MHRPSDTLEAQDPAQFSDEKLIAGLRYVLSSQCRTTARLVAFMAEVDARGLYRGFAYASMFQYAVEALHMSEGEAFPRIYAGRIARKYPVVLAMLERGELHLSGIRLIGPLLTADNHVELLAAVRFKSKREIKKVVASRSPKDDVKSGTRKLPERKWGGSVLPSAAMTLGLEPREQAKQSPQPSPAEAAACPTASVQFAACQVDDAAGAARLAVPAMPPVPGLPAPTTASSTPMAVTAAIAHTAPAREASAAQTTAVPPCTTTSQADAEARAPFRQAGGEEAGGTSRGVAVTRALSREPGSREGGVTMTPLRADRYKVQFTAEQRLHDKIKQAQHLLRGQLPSGDLAEIVERALDLLIAQRMKQRFGVGRKPAPAKPAAAKSPDVQPPTGQPSRYIPAEVRRQVAARDGMQCTFVSAAGKRCEQRGDLEFHHEHPFARGGEASVANIRLLCAAHNGLLAERDYGRELIRQRIDGSPRGVRDAAFVWNASEAAGYGRSLASILSSREACVSDLLSMAAVVSCRPKRAKLASAERVGSAAGRSCKQLSGDDAACLIE